MNDNRDQVQYAPSPFVSLSKFVAGVSGALLLLGIIVYLATSWKAVVAYSWVALLVLSILIVFLLIVACLYLREDLRDRRQQRDHEHKRLTHELRLQATRLYADERGNRPFIFDEDSRQVIEIQSGNYLQPVPNHFAPHYEYNDESTHALDDMHQAQLPMPANVAQPSMDYIVSQLQENTLQVCLGVSATVGQPFIMDLIEGTHYRIVGGSGFGKSCEAAAILDQVTQTNDPEHLMIALLDLEHKTSRLFEDLPHVADLQIGRKRVPMVATNADEVAQHFRYLRTELDRRKVLSESDLKRERFVLIYVEEFLSLKREVDPGLKQQMMDDFSILALRGRKYGLYLLACAQVDYSDKSLRDAMNQFNVNMSFSVKPTAARAIGFTSSDLLKQNFEAKKRGQFVLETTGCTDIMLAPQYDVKAKLLQMERRSAPFAGPDLHILNGGRTTSERYENGSQNDNERPSEEHSAEVARLRAMGWGKQAIIEKVWNVTKGGSPKYKAAEAEYEQIVSQLEAMEA